MAKYRVEMEDGRVYEMDAPEGTSKEVIYAAIQQRDPFAFKSTEALEAAPSAPFKAADIGRAAKAGIAGGLQSVTDIFGAGNVASRYLEEAQKSAFEGMSPEVIEEIQRREEIKKRAEGKGIGKEISAYVGGFTEAPLRTAVQALAGSAPIIASSLLPGGQATGIARLLSAARGPTAVGAAMGLGGQKGQDYETVKQALLEQGVPEPEAERRAQEASAYSMQNILRQAGAAAAGAAEGRFGVEPAVGKLLTRRTATGAVKPPTWDVAIGQSILGEAAPEALQAAVGQLGTNQALNQAGIPTEITKGLAGTVAHDALVGAVLGLGLSPAQKANMARDYAATQQEERNKRQEEERAKIAEIERKQREEYEKAGYAAVQKPLAPADLTKNPLGSFTAEDLQPEVVAYIDNYRNQMGLPKISEYSVEDIADAMPGLDKKREREALGEIVGKKAGYTPEATVSVQNVLDQALAKNIDIEGKGFTDFLARTTGVSDFKEMTNPQLFAAYKAISALPDSPTVREMEAGTNAVRFDDTQYTAGLNALDITLEGLKRPVSVAAAVDEIKFASGLRSDKAANALLEEAIRRGDLDETQTPRFEVVKPSTGEILGRRYDTAEEAEKAKPEGAEVRQVSERQIAPPTKVAALPEGYDIQEGLLKTGEAPQAFDIKAGDQILSRVKSEEEAQAKLNSYSQTRAAEVANAQKVIERQQKRVVDSAQRLNAMEAGGQGRTAAYQNMAAKHARLIDEVNKIIARQNDRIKKFDPSITPITISPVGAKAVGRTGFTVLKGGVPLTTLPTREAAERAVLGDLTTGRLEELAQKKERRGLGPKAAEEIERRAGRLKPEKSPEVEALEQNLRKVLDKFGLKDVALEVAEAIAGGKAGGSYLNSLIKVALDEKNPVRTLRHESLHALRDLGFFTDQQWNALTNQAKGKWIDTYLKQRNIDGEPLKAGETSRYDAYVMAYKGDIDAIVEEAIADAFADFDVNKAPPGMLSALLNKLRSFFEALRNALSGAGFQTAEDVFGKIERAELAPTKKAEAEEKLSLRIMRDEEEPKFEGKVTVDKVGKYFDDQIKAAFKRQLDYNNPEDFARAIDEAGKEVAYQLEREKSGLDWYEEDIKRAFTDTIKIIPELKKEENRILFTVMAGIMSPQTNARDNWFIAAKGFQHYLKTGTIPGVNPDTGGLWQGGTTSANKKVALEFLDRLVNQLGKKKAIEWIMNDHTVKEINEYRAKYGLLKSGIDGKMGDIKPGLYAFGPKVGPFVSNINGIHDVTVDMWMTRTFNRYFGTMIGPDGKIVDAPTEPQRKAIKDLVNKVAQNANIKPYQVQSVLWFYEQSLFSKLGTPAPSYGFSDGAAKFVDDARGGGGKKGVAVAPKKAERLSIRQNRELFKKAEQIPMSEGVEIIRDNWIGGVSGIGDRDGAYDLYRVKGGPEYTAAVRDFIRENVGDNFKGYRLMSPEELEELRTGSMGSQFVSFTLNPDVAKAFKNLPRYAKRSDLVVAEMDLTPEHVNMIGHPGEEELVIDYGQGYDPDAIKVVEGEEKLSLRAPQTPEFKQWFGNSKIVDENGEPKVMYHGTARDFEAFQPRQANAIFLTDNAKFAESFSDMSKDYAVAEMVNMLDAQNDMQVKRDILIPLIDDAIAEKDLATVENTGGLRKETREGHIDYFLNRPLKDAMQTAALGDRLYKAMVERLPVRENIIPVYVKAENPFDFENPTHVRRLMAGLKKQISGDYLMTSGGRMAMKDVPTAMREGSWKIIEAEDVQEVLRDLFDGFYVKEGGVKNLAVYKPNQIKSVFNARPTERPEMRLSLRTQPFNPDKLPKTNRDYILPQGTILYHGAYKSVADAIQSAGYLKSRPEIKAHGGLTNEGGLIWFGSEETARNYANSKADPMSVQADEEAGIVREPGRVFESIVDKPYRLINREKILSQSEADALNKALGLPEYKQLRKGNTVGNAAYRADDYKASTIDRYEVKSGKYVDKISAPWPVILKTLNADGFYDNKTIALTAENGIRLSEEGRPMERFSIRASIDPSLMAMVNRTTHQRDEKTFIQSITEAIAPKSWSHFRQQALNRYNRLSEADKIRAEKMGGKYLMADASAESAALMSDLAAGVSASALGVHDRNGGIPVYRNGITTVWNDNGNIKGPTAIFAPLAKYNDPAVYQLYQFWAGSKRARRLYDQGKERLYTPAEITRANELLQQFPEFEDIQKEWVKYNNGLMEYAVATGVLSRERADEFMRYSDYVPFYRQLDGEGSVGPKIFQAISGVKPPKKIKGGEQPLDDFLETVVRNTQSIIQSGMKNVAAQRAVKLAVDIDLGERLPKKASGPDIVTVLENGQEVSYAVADPLFIEAVKSLNLPDLPFIGLLSGPANLLRNLVTKDPGFMLANMMRDSMAAWVTSGVNMTPVSSTVINFGKAFAGKSPEFQALLNAGVIGGYEFSQNVIEGAKTLEKSLGKAAGVAPTGAGLAAKPFTSLWETLEKGTTASDAATRMEVYKQVLAETGNEAEALYRALEVMNFNRKGSSAVVRILTAAVPFLNARMQGLDVLYRAAFGQMANKDAAAIQRAFFVRGMTIAAISCMYWALTHDDDEYKKQEEETKDNNWLIPSLGVKIPIPFEVGVLFKVIPERIMAYTFGEDTGQDFLKSMGRNLAATLMINPIPQTVLPVVEATTNFSFFTMRPIVGQGMADVAPQFQVGPSTSIIAEEIGGALGISPMKLDHMIKGYTGTMGMYMVDLIDSILNVNRDSPRPAARFEQLPVIKRFALDPEARGNVTAYYDLKNSVDETVRTGNFLERSQNFDALGQYKEETMHMLATRDYVLDLEKTMKELREVKVRIRASDLSSEEKRDALIEVNRREDQLTKNIREVRAFARQ